MRTRLYVPARTFWGALTVRLVQKTDLGNYNDAGEFLKKQMRFGYLYFSDGEKLFIPQYTEQGLKLGSMHSHEFEEKYVCSISTTAIDAHSLSAEEETLHHLEYINPRSIKDSSPLLLKGFLWLKKSEDTLSEGNDFLFIYRGIQLKLSELLQTLQLGGERKYGFGQVELVELKVIEKEVWDNWKEEGDSINITIPEKKPVWAHVEYSLDLNMKGEIEVFMGREWNNEKGAGRNITLHGLCWVPGSIVEEETTFEITCSGTWRKIYSH